MKIIFSAIFSFLMIIFIIALFTSPIWITLILVNSRNKQREQRKTYQQQYYQRQFVYDQQPLLQPNQQQPIYNKSNLLTQYETLLYNKLDEIARQNNLRVISKIRLADLIQCTNNNYTNFNRISRKHIDFALCSSDNLTPLILIELDDNSHNTPERRQRDDFVNQSVVQAGYKILHIRNINDIDINNKIQSYIQNDIAGVYYI